MKAQREVKVVPGHPVILLHPREYRWGRGVDTTENIYDIEITQNSFFYYSRVT